MAAPMRPPIRAWLLELGIDKRHVIRFQLIAPSNAATRTRDPAPSIFSSTMSPLMVLATVTPKTNAPTKLAVAESRIAYSGFSARVATDVAIAFAVSWKPLM